MGRRSALMSSLLLGCSLLLSLASAVRLPPPPQSLIIAYTDWGQCDDKIVQAAKDGVNVVNWMAVDLLANGTVSGSIADMACVANVTKTIASLGLDVTHLVTIGGWDRPHPATTIAGSKWWEIFKAWNANIKASYGFEFDGIDWDTEGMNEATSSDNIFTLALLHLIGDMSASAKADGYSVSLTPCESYMDVYQPLFDYSLTHAYLEYPAFPYHGRNAMAYLMAAYKSAFDVVSVQLYESWSHANYQISIVQVPAAAFLEGWARQIMHGWYCYFATTSAGCDIPSQWINIPADKLVVGLANAWTGSVKDQAKVKALYIDPSEVQSAFYNLNASNASAVPRGVMFWTISAEGKAIEGSTEPVWFAKEMNKILRIR